MKAAVYDRFWHSMGGGERHSGMIAQLLAQAGVDVDLVGHSDVSLDELGSRLALDLSRASLRIVPDRGEAAMAEVTADYDLFVNSTYMSRVEPRSKRSAYLCFFPTPFDHDLPLLHRKAIRILGPRLAHPETPESPAALRYGTGWYPQEGGRRRRWAWSNGEGVLLFGAGPGLTLEVDCGRPGAVDSVEVSIEFDGTTRQVLQVAPEFASAQIELPAADHVRELRLRSATFSPGQHDPRSLGVALSRLRVSGARLRPRERVAIRYPWLLRRPDDMSFVQSYNVVLANSAYTQGWIRTLWQSESEILFPPIEVNRVACRQDRSKVILSVGRFFAPGYGHSKRQLEMVRMFGDIVRSGLIPDWRLVVIGGCEDSQRPYLERVTAAAAGLPVEIHANAPRSLVDETMGSAAIFWSATGFGEDTNKRPWTNEHFGMTTAESMAGGCVPVVIDRAGQREIVRDGVDGFRWTDPSQLRIRTLQVATDEALRARLSAAAVHRAQEFSDSAFAKRWNRLIVDYDLLQTSPPRGFDSGTEHHGGAKSVRPNPRSN